MSINYVFIVHGFPVVLSTRKPGVGTPTGAKIDFLGVSWGCLCVCLFLFDGFVDYFDCFSKVADEYFCGRPIRTYFA